MEEVPFEFECSLCLKLLLDPVSVSCGHTYCRQCINKSQEYRTACPLCRKPVHAGAGVNVLLSNIIAERFPKALEQRQQERGAELTSVDVRPVSTLPVCVTEESIVPGHRCHIEINDNAAAFHAAIAGGHTLILHGPVISTVSTIEHLARSEAHVVATYRCAIENEEISESGYVIGQAVEIADDPLPSNDLVSESEGSLISLWEEAVALVNEFLSTMGDSGRAVFFEKHGGVPQLHRGDCSAASMIGASWWLCGAVRGPEERLLTTNTRARIESSMRILRENRHKMAPFVMPGGAPWALGGKQSLLLLLIILLVAYLKYAGMIGASRF